MNQWNFAIINIVITRKYIIIVSNRMNQSLIVWSFFIHFLYLNQSQKELFLFYRITCLLLLHFLKISWVKLVPQYGTNSTKSLREQLTLLRLTGYIQHFASIFLTKFLYLFDLIFCEIFPAQYHTLRNANLHNFYYFFQSICCPSIHCIHLLNEVP